MNPTQRRDPDPKPPEGDESTTPPAGDGEGSENGEGSE